MVEEVDAIRGQREPLDLVPQLSDALELARLLGAADEAEDALLVFGAVLLSLQCKFALGVRPQGFGERCVKVASSVIFSTICESAQPILGLPNTFAATSGE